MVPDWLVAAGGGGAFSIADWFDGMDKLFNIDSYLQTYFDPAEKLLQAEAELARAREAVQGEEPDTAALEQVKVLERWVACVKAYAADMKEYLRSDSIAAPGDSQKRWLFFIWNGKRMEREHSRPLESGVYKCSVCDGCLRPLGKRDSKGKAKPSMPREAREMHALTVYGAVPRHQRLQP